LRCNSPLHADCYVVALPRLGRSAAG